MSRAFLESLQTLPVVYSATETAVADRGVFNPGDRLKKRLLAITVVSRKPIAPGLLELRLVATGDAEYIRTPVLPLKARKNLRRPARRVTFHLRGPRVPIPNGILYLPTVVTTEQDIELHCGTALEYYFILRMGAQWIPLTAHYLGSEARCDVKCEKLECLDAPDEDHPIKIVVTENDGAKYCRIPHCVTHCRAPRPQLMYYSPNNRSPPVLDDSPPTPCLTCQNQ